MLSFILACYVLCLSVGPILAKALCTEAEEHCATSCCIIEHEDVAAMDNTDASPDGCCDDGKVCNPFAGCAGCAGFTVPAVPIITGSVNEYMTQPLSHRQIVPRLADHAIWHPPQFI